MNEVIKSEKLCKTYNKTPAVNNISLSVKRGTVFGLIGANGAGKSTTIECILGTKTADSGEISILGMNPQTSRKQLFQKVGVQFQEATYQDNITAVSYTHLASKHPMPLPRRLAIMPLNTSPLPPVAIPLLPLLF